MKSQETSTDTFLHCSCGLHCTGVGGVGLKDHQRQTALGAAPIRVTDSIPENSDCCGNCSVVGDNLSKSELHKAWAFFALSLQSVLQHFVFIKF